MAKGVSCLCGTLGRGLGLVLFAVLVLSASRGYSEIPQTLSYQGSLTDASGSPVDGTVTITFSLYDTATGGSALWQETRPVAVSGGAFNVILGTDAANPLEASIFGTPLYLGITVGGDAEMTLRQALAAVGYAMRSSVAESLASGVSSYSRVSGPTITVGPGSAAVGLVVCPSGMKVVGGGHDSPTNYFRVRDNYPISESTWQVMLFNTAPDPKSFVPWAVCLAFK